MDDVLGWAKSHPVEAGGIALVGVVAVLYFLGFFSSSSSSASSSGTDLASAYYTAEAAQTNAGAQEQIATTQANEATSIATAQYGAETSIATTEANQSTTNTAAQYASADQTALYAAQTAQYQAQQATALGLGQAADTSQSADYAAQQATLLGLTQSNNNLTLGTLQSNNAALVANDAAWFANNENSVNDAAAIQEQEDAINGSLNQTWLQQIVAPESWRNPGMSIQAQGPGGSYVAFNPAMNPAGLAQVGYNQQEIDALLGIG